MRKLVCTLLFAGLLLFPACRRQQTGVSAAAESDRDGKPLIAATFYPLYIALMNITDGADVRIELLAPPDTGCLHDYQLTAANMITIENADILIVNGAGMEDFPEKALSGKSRVINASEGFPLIDGNPHIWLSPKGAIQQTQRITDFLAEYDVKNGDLYRKNGAEYAQKLKELAVYMHERLDEFAGQDIITFHEAFPYFAQEFGLNVTAVIEREPGSEPTAKELNSLIATIRQAGLQNKHIALFAERQYSPSAAQIIARETGLPVYELDPAVTGTLEKDAYIQAMKQNTQVLQTALR